MKKRTGGPPPLNNDTCTGQRPPCPDTLTFANTFCKFSTWLSSFSAESKEKSLDYDPKRSRRDMHEMKNNSLSNRGDPCPREAGIMNRRKIFMIFMRGGELTEFRKPLLLTREPPNAPNRINKVQKQRSTNTKRRIPNVGKLKICKMPASNHRYPSDKILQTLNMESITDKPN